MTTVFDSLKYAKRLMDAGVSAAAADVQAETMLEVMTQVSACTAKVGDQDSKIDRLDSKIDRATAELKALIEQAKSELIRWAVGLTIAAVGAMSALKLLH